ncbi:MAG: hypothetical protein ACYTGN_07160 [Planctomycetota bacterium]|jgi:hypothetical protein
MRILGYAAAPFHAEFPPPGARRKPRLPTAATALARHAVGEIELPPETAVMFGTGYGAATETEAFVENMIRHDEQAPKPRAFSVSVHNAIASKISITLGAKGPSRTFVHGALSFPLALQSAMAHEWAIVGGLDESSPYIRLGRTACGEDAGGEGGGVLFAGPHGTAKALLRLDGEAETWLNASREHPSTCATLTALACGVVWGDLEPGVLDLRSRPQSIGIRVVARTGGRARIVVEQPVERP